jgi:hypothetical protein
MRQPIRLALIGLAAVVVGLMAVGYSFIFRGVATAPDVTVGTLEIPGPGDLVAAASLDDGTPVFVVSFDGAVNVLDARAPVAAGTVPTLVAWCGAIQAFETGPIVEGGDLVGTLGFDPDGTSFGLFASEGLARHAIRRVADNRLVVLSASTRAGGRVNGLPDCPAGSDRVMHRPAPGEVLDPSVAVDSEPPGVIWLEGTLRAIGNQALLCDGTRSLIEGCERGAVARGIDPATIPPEGMAGFFIGVVRDGGIAGLVHALVLSESEGS